MNISLWITWSAIKILFWLIIKIFDRVSVCRTLHTIVILYGIMHSNVGTVLLGVVQHCIPLRCIDFALLPFLKSLPLPLVAASLIPLTSVQPPPDTTSTFLPLWESLHGTETTRYQSTRRFPPLSSHFRTYPSPHTLQSFSSFS